MRRITSSVTKRGQVTIPSAVRRCLGIGLPGNVTFEIDGDVVRIARERYTVDSLFGFLPSLPDGMTIEEAIELAKDEHSLKVAQEGL